MCDYMKIIKFLFVFICALFLGFITVSACTSDDCCTGCSYYQAETSCKAAMTQAQKDKCSGKSSNSSSCNVDSCCSNCATETMASSCRQSMTSAQKNKCNGGNSSNNGSNGGGSSNNGGGSSITPEISSECDDQLKETCETQSDPVQSLKDKCNECGFPLKTYNNGNGTQDGTLYTDDDTGITKLTGCENVFGELKDGKFDKDSLGYFLQVAFNVVKYIVPVLLIVLTSVDYLKAISSGDKENVNKATTKLTKRAIIALAIFLVPTILNFILKIVAEYGTCGIK